MHRQIGGPAMAWQAAQANSTFERANPASDRDTSPFPETVALNSESDQTLRDAIAVKSSPYLGPVSLTNDRPSKILQAAHLAIADQSPFNLRNTDPKLSIRELTLPSHVTSAPRVVAEVVQSTVPVPLPPRSNFDAAGKNIALPGAVEVTQAVGQVVAIPLANESYRATAESYRGAYRPADSYRPLDVQRSSQTNISVVPAVETTADVPPVVVASVVTSVSIAPSIGSSIAQSFNADPKAIDSISSPSAHADAGHLNAAWGLSEEPSSLKGTLNSLWPGVGSAPKKASVSFDAGMQTASKTVIADSNNSKAIKAGDALHTGRMGNVIARSKDTNRMQTCMNLPLFDTHSMQTKFQAANVTFSKSISPTGERTQVQTASDFSSITEVWTPSTNETGTYLYKSVYRDELNRVRYEESVNEQGLRTIVQTGYCDKEDKKSPFVAYKMVIRPDGSRELLA